MSTVVGSVIKKVRWMTEAELEKEGWEEWAGNPHRPGIALEMEGGGKIYASRDPEGNGPGAFFGETAEGETVYIMPEEPFQQGT